MPKAAADSIPTPVQRPERPEVRIANVGEDLLRGLGALLSSVNSSSSGPQQLAKDLGVDKVLASRVLKMIRSQDPLAAAHLAPGPEPLRRIVKAASKAGAPASAVQTAGDAIARFEELVRVEAGDRSGLDAMLSAWLPEVRSEFELRRKQAAFRALSQLKGVSADVDFGTVVIAPSQTDESRLDVVWLFGVFGLQRVRPGAQVTFATRRLTPDVHDRTPRTLDGKPVENLTGLRLPQFCSDPPPEIDVVRKGETVRYDLAGDAFGPASAADLVFAEVNHAELDRDAIDRGRAAYAFAEIGTPVKKLIFTVLVHEDVYTGIEPSLRIYDTALEGLANPNDETRTPSQWDLLERLDSLGAGAARFGTAEVPRYREMLDEVFGKLAWNRDQFRGYRCRVEFPIYGSQVTILFQRQATS